MNELSRGARISVVEGESSPLIIDVSWGGQPGECESAMFVCDPYGRALSGRHLVYWNGESPTPERAVFLRLAPLRAQFEVHLAALEAKAQRLDVVLTALRGEVEQVGVIRIVVWDPRTGTDLARYDAPVAGPGRSVLVGRLSRNETGWEFQALCEYHDRDLEMLAFEYGVTG